WLFYSLGTEKAASAPGACPPPMPGAFLGIRSTRRLLTSGGVIGANEVRKGCFGARTPQTSGWAGEGGAALCPRREGPSGGGGELQRGAPGSFQTLLSVPRAEALSPKWACYRRRGGERELTLWGLGKAGGVEGQRQRRRGAAGTAGEGREEKAEEGNPSCPQHPSVSCYQPKGAASGRGDRSR
ncbi:hypothetical protein P7K49_039060, partial [Saguinus oedipus]